MGRQDIDYFVLDTLANDLEAIEDILRMLNSGTELGWRHAHPSPFTRPEIVAALSRLIRDDLVEACVPHTSESHLVGAGARALPDGSWEDLWFLMTPRGRLLHTAWDPPLPESEPRRTGE